MPVRPSRLWKDMPLENRLLAADAFWRDDQQDAGMQQVEAIVALAKRMNFRPKSVQALSIEKRTKHLSQMQDVSDAVATRALIAYHFASRRPLMAAFLDALGIAHEDGLIKEDSVPPPPKEKLAAAITAVRGSFPQADVDLYVQTLAALDGETWVEAEAALTATA